MCDSMTTSTEKTGRFSLQWFRLLFAVSLVFLILTVVMRLGFFPYSVAVYLRRFSLAFENNLGAWWSGMLLLLLSLHSTDGYALHKRASPEIAKAWAIFASILAFFSLDEVGSIHERIAELSYNLNLGDWAFLIPLGIVLGALLARALLTIWLAGGQNRHTAILLLLGFAMLGSVAIQEYLEHKLVFESSIAQALRLGLEEGTELAGMLVLLWVMRNNTAPFAPPGRRGLPTFAVLAKPWLSLLVIALIFAPFAVVLTTTVPFDDLGRPCDWLAASFFGLAALAFVRPSLAQGRNPAPKDWVVIALCLLASICVIVIPGSSQRIVFGDLYSTRLVALSGLGLLLGVIGMTSAGGMNRYAGRWGLLALASTTLPFIADAPWSIFLLSQVLSIGVFAIIVHLESHSAQKSCAG